MSVAPFKWACLFLALYDSRVCVQHDQDRQNDVNLLPASSHSRAFLSLSVSHSCIQIPLLLSSPTNQKESYAMPQKSQTHMISISVFMSRLFLLLRIQTDG